MLLSRAAPLLLSVLHSVPLPSARSARATGVSLVAEKELVEPPSISECVEASFVPAVMGVARGDVTELKLFIASAQAAYRTSEEVDALTAAMDALPVQSAGRPLMPEESAVRADWIGLVYLTLERLAAVESAEEEEAEASEGGSAAADLVPRAMRTEYAAMVKMLVRAKRESVPLSTLNIVDVVGGGERGEAEAALLKQAMRVVYLTLDNVESERDAGDRADAPSKKGDFQKQPPKPFIPGT